jgi:hypothetical protein
VNHVKQKPAPRPFFARFLDHQDMKKVDGGTASAPDNTDKYPSDKEDHGELTEE